MKKPVVSVCLCLRNDNYGGDQTERFKLFIKYYSKVQEKYNGLIEFVICDYNSQPGHQIHEMNLPWESLRPAKSILVNSAQHEKLSQGRGRPILDYVGRNIAVRHAAGEFILILNQDIFITESILELCLSGKLSKEFFYRADRWDVVFKVLRDGLIDQLVSNAKSGICSLSRRHSPEYDKITIPYANENLNEIASQSLQGEQYDSNLNIIFGKQRSIFSRIKQALFKATDFEKLGLHTNASGDFILCSKKAWEEIRGAVETTEFYLHTDSYLVAQLYGAGYRQAIFDLPHQVFHADHDRSARLNFQESIPYEVHKKRLADIALGTVPPLLNNKNWGMYDESLEVIEI